ncbi:hypothetical protein L0Y65_00925 [Candidatus Micrarchaeota archaeon]|nr:hypothetical protein [Candidatus Micrarchaeota archaeon]
MDDRLQMLVYLALATALVAPLMEPGYYLTLDMQFGPNSFSNSQFGDFYGFAPSSYGAYFPLKMALSAISELVSVELAEKLLIFSIFLLCGLSMHLALPRELGASRLYGGMLYMINPFVFIRFLAGHWSLLLSYSLWPIALAWFMEFLDRPNDMRILAKVALATSAAAVSSHGVIMLLAAYAVVFSFRAFRLGKAAELLKPSLILALTVLALNSYWIIPTALLFGQTYNPAPAAAYLQDFSPTDRSLSVEAAVLSMHGFWRGGFFQTKDILPEWPILFIAIVLLSAAGALYLFRIKRYLAVSLIVIFLAAFLLALGRSSPVSWVFTAMGNAVPVHMLFRDSQKFVGLLCLAYSFLGAYGVHSIRSLFPRISPVFLIASLLIVIAFDYSIFGFQGQVGITNYPEDWYRAERIIQSDPVNSSILALPPYLYGTYPWLNSVQKTLGTPASQFFSKPVITSSAVVTANVYGDTRDSWGNYLSYLFKKRQYVNDTASILAPLNVRYILIFKQYDIYDNYLWLFQRRGGVRDIELVYEGESAYLFRNNLAGGSIYASEDPGLEGFWSLVDSGAAGLIWQDGAFEKMHPFKYLIGPSNSTYIVLPNPDGSYFEYNGQSASDWHGIGSVFINTGPGFIINRLYYATLALFALSWSLALILLCGHSLRHAAAAALFGAAIFFLAGEGILYPVHLGALLIMTASAGLIVFNFEDLRGTINRFNKLK